MSSSIKELADGLTSRRKPRLIKWGAIGFLVLVSAGAGYCTWRMQARRGRVTLRQSASEGPAEFLPVSGTPVEYAANTVSTLVRIGSTYYLFREGSWFRATSADGPYSRIEGTPVELCEMVEKLGP